MRALAATGFPAAAPGATSGVAAFDSTQTKSTTVTISNTDNINIGTLLFNSNITTTSQAITFNINRRRFAHP